MPVTLTSGDDITISAQLYKDEAAFSISGGADVKARVIGTSHSTVHFTTVTCDSGASGADWANSLVVITFPASATSGSTHRGPAVLEIEVNDGGKNTFFADVVLEVGTI